MRRHALALGLLSLLVPASSSAATRYAAREVVLQPAHGIARVVAPRPGESVPAAAARLARAPGVRAARPNYLAHIAGFSPRDPGRGSGWAELQWNFLSRAGVNVQPAWRNLIRARRPGARGVTVAVLDTGVAYLDRGPYRRSPDFTHTHFVSPRDIVDDDAYPVDDNGHGTHVAGTIAENTGNGVGVTGLAYGVDIMPVRVLNAKGEGDALTVARGIDYAVGHGADVVNLSLEFPDTLGPGDVPEVIAAVRRARAHGVLVVGAAGNIDSRLPRAVAVSEPAREASVLSVGATTDHRCVASYSQHGSGLDLVAPGGGRDARRRGDRNCHPGPHQRPIYQLTFRSCAEDPPPCGPASFFLPSFYIGTSMAAPHVSGVAALVIASGVLGRHPSPAAVIRRLERTADPLGPRGYDRNYGWGLVNAGRATSSG